MNVSIAEHSLRLNRLIEAYNYQFFYTNTKHCFILYTKHNLLIQMLMRDTKQLIHYVLCAISGSLLVITQANVSFAVR